MCHEFFSSLFPKTTERFGMPVQIRTILPIRAALLLLALFPPFAFADLFPALTQAELAYGVLGVGGTSVSMDSTTIFGSVGVGSGGSFNAMTGSTVFGTVDFQGASNATIDLGSSVIGGVHANVAQVATAVADVTALSSSLSALSGTPLILNVSTGQTVTLNPGVYDITGDASVFQGTVFLSGSSTDQYVFNIGAGNTLTVDFGSILPDLGGNVQPDNVIFNLSGSGPAASISNNSSVTGIILGLDRELDLPNGTLDGRVWGASNQALSFGPNFTVFAPIPEPRTIFLVAPALIAMWCLRKRNRKFAVLRIEGTANPS
jgi:hypothetical protein